MNTTVFPLHRGPGSPAGAFHCCKEKGRQSDGPDFAKTIKAFMDSNPYCIVYRFIYLYLS
jgi:hypothetical protein